MATPSRLPDDAQQVRLPSTRAQRNVLVASFLGWMLDAFDFFLLVFVLKDIAAESHVGIPSVAVAITLTLAMCPIGAFLFGHLADRYGRRPMLMLNVLLYSVLAALSGLAPSLAVLLVVRALFGVAMGGEWGIGSALTMETVPAHARRFVSGILQAGYPAGYLVAAIAFGLLYPYIGWRGMLFLGIVPALVIFFIRRNVEESPTWRRDRALSVRHPGFGDVLRRHAGLAIYAIALMTAFNFFSHGTRDPLPDLSAGPA